MYKTYKKCYERKALLWKCSPLWCHKMPAIHNFNRTPKPKDVKTKILENEKLVTKTKGKNLFCTLCFPISLTNIPRFQIHQYNVWPLNKLEVVHLTNACTDLYSLLKAERREDERDNWIRWDCLCCNLVYSKCTALETAKLIMAQRLELGSNGVREAVASLSPWLT